MSHDALTHLPVSEAEVLAFRGYSRCQASIWTTWPRLGLQIDAGEGAATLQGDDAGTPPLLAITHGHGDHVLGLLGMIIARLGHTTRRGGPLTILYPEGAREVEVMRETAQALYGYMAPEDWARITWEPIRAGARRPIGGRRTLVAFPTRHYLSPGRTSLGYAVVRPHWALRPQFEGATEAEVRAAVARDGRETVLVEREAVLLAQTGDTMPLDEPLVREARVRMLDATFLTPEDRGAGKPTHAAVTEWVERLAGTPGHVVFHHLSLRYAREDLAAQIAALVGTALPGGVSWLDHGQWEMIAPPAL